MPEKPPKPVKKFPKIPAFYFDPNYLSRVAAEARDSFRKAKPFPHVVIDNFLPLDIANAITKEFPSIGAIPWEISGPGICYAMGGPNLGLNKVQKSDENCFPPFIRHMMMVFNSATFLGFLEDVSGVKNLFPDPSFTSCGLHSTGRGGKLMIHADQSRHPSEKLDQMLNMIYFTNKNWKNEYYGHLDLFNFKTKKTEVKIAPIFNRMVIFNTGTKTFHGHPEPLNCPLDLRRNSMAAYYYVFNRPRDEHYTKKNDAVEWLVTRLDEQADLKHRGLVK
jgi:hypothetical protein